MLDSVEEDHSCKRKKKFQVIINYCNKHCNQILPLNAPKSYTLEFNGDALV